jgi:hypothetical protein
MKISLEHRVLRGRRAMGRFPSVFPKGRSQSDISKGRRNIIGGIVLPKK